MKKTLLVLLSFAMMSNIASADFFSIKKDDLPTCKEKLALLQLIAYEKCRTIPVPTSGTNYTLEMLHRNVCKDASSAVVTQAKECLAIAGLIVA